MHEQKPPFWTSAEFWISMSATVIALISLVFSISESRRSREHDRRLSTPRLGVTFWYKEDSAGFSIGNVGLGPARLEWFQVLVDGKPQTNWRSMLEEIGFKPNPPPYGFIVPTPGYWYKPEYTREIFSIEKPSSLLVKQESGRIDLKGCYCSVYEECWIFRRSSLETEKVSVCYPVPEITLIAPLPRHSQ